MKSLAKMEGPPTMNKADTKSRIFCKFGRTHTEGVVNANSILCVYTKQKQACVHLIFLRSITDTKSLKRYLNFQIIYNNYVTWTESGTSVCLPI